LEYLSELEDEGARISTIDPVWEGRKARRQASEVSGRAGLEGGKRGGGLSEKKASRVYVDMEEGPGFGSLSRTGGGRGDGEGEMGSEAAVPDIW
jgi:hypothetical protein